MVASRRLIEVGPFQKSTDADFWGVGVEGDREQFGEEVFAEEVEDAVRESGGGGEAVEFASVNRQAEADRGMGQSMDDEDLLDVILLGHVGA